MFEHHRDPLLPQKQFMRRVGKFIAFAFLLVVVSWAIGICGYAFFEHMSFIDSMLNSAMILGGMGPVNQLTTNGGKLFASFYALFSGMIFLIAFGVLLAPIIHRLFHKFHIENESSS